MVMGDIAQLGPFRLVATEEGWEVHTAEVPVPGVEVLFPRRVGKDVASVSRVEQRQLENALVEHREALNDLAAEVYGEVSRYGWTSAKTLVAKALERLQEKPPRGRPFHRG
jgi:hypothetical protein